MKTEGIAELKELDRIVQECAALTKERDELRNDKKQLELILCGRLMVETRYISISKTKLEAILKQYYNCESAEIEKIRVGTSITPSTVYPSSLEHALLLDTDISIRIKTLIYNITKDKSAESV